MSPSQSETSLKLELLRRNHARSSKFSHFKTTGRKLTTIPEEAISHSSQVFQSIAWTITEKSMYRLVQKVKEKENLDLISKQIVRLNMFRSRGLFCHYLMEAQLISTEKSYLYAKLTAIINNELPHVGELLLKRLIYQFKKYYYQTKFNECMATAIFIAELIKYGVGDSILALDIIILLIAVNSTDNTFEIAFTIFKICQDKMSKKRIRYVLQILNEATPNKTLNTMALYMYDVTVNSVSIPGLKFIHKTENKTKPHILNLKIYNDPEYKLNYYSYDDDYSELDYMNELFFKSFYGKDKFKEFVLMYENQNDEKQSNKKNVIKQNENAKMSLELLKNKIEFMILDPLFDYESCAYQLMQMKLVPGLEYDLCFVLLDFCCEHVGYNFNVGQITQILCQLNRLLRGCLEMMFMDSYASIDHYHIKRLQNYAKYFAHLFRTDTIDWDILSVIHLNEFETTSASRRFFKLLILEIAEHMEHNLNQRVRDPNYRLAFSGIFLKDSENISQFSINFLTNIGLGDLIYEFRESLLLEP